MGRRFLHEGRVVHAASIGLEKVHYQPAARREMAARAAQAAELLLHREQVLERPEGDVDEAEGFAQLKIGHIAVDQPDTITDRGRLVFELCAAARQHRLGEIQAHRTQTCLRSEEHTSELQSRGHLVCRLLLEKKKNQHIFSSRTDPSKMIYYPCITSNCVMHSYNILS